MKPLDLMEGLGEIDDRYIKEAETYQARSISRPVILRWASAAACLALVLCGGIAYFRAQNFFPAGENTPEAAQFHSIDSRLKEKPEADAYSEETVLELPGNLRYLPVSDAETLKENGLPAEIAEQDVGKILTHSAEGLSVCEYLPLADAAAVRVLCGEDGSRRFLLYRGGAEALTLGELYGLEQGADVVSADLSGKAFSEKDCARLGAVLRPLSPAESESVPEENGLPELHMALKNGLSFTLELDAEHALLLHFDRTYPAGEELSEILNPYLGE